MTKKRIAFIFPGQGAQYPGMGRDFYDLYPVARETFEEADDLLGERFSSLIFSGSPSELTLTKNSQLAIYITSSALLRTLEQQFPSLRPDVCAGLSLGEYTALTAAEKLSFAHCLPLVKARGKYMHEACEANLGSMQVVLGLDESAVERALLELNSSVWIANINCPGQIVIAGTPAGLEAAAAYLKEKGAKRLLPLDVAGAFHSGLMRSAQERLAPLITQAPFQKSATALVMNVPGNYVTEVSDMRHFLVEQVVSPVRWEKGIRAIEEKQVEGYLEIGPGKTLQGMNKRIGVTAPTLSIEKVTDLEELFKFMEENHAASAK